MTTSKQTPVAVLALNPAVDISYELPQLIEYQKVAASRTRYYPGGNGINVSRALTELDVPVNCCSAVGGETGDLLLRLLGDTLAGHHRRFQLDGETRLNTNLTQFNPPGQYEITSIGPEVSRDVLDSISEAFLEETGSGIGVLTGQLPPGAPDTTYRRLALAIDSQGGKAVVDAHGSVLELALEAEPFLVRLNRFALEMKIRRRLDSVQAVAESARQIQKCGVDFVCVSMGQEGAVLLDSENSYHCPAPRVHKQSTVGSGDSLLAGLVAAVLRNESTVEMLCFGVLCGSATAMHPGTGLFRRDDIEKTGSGQVQAETLDL